ncbi:MAG TPA: CrcB family protein [Acidimicrobiales bacterium]|nr:CrcB family protein [Acidimicrobiales bacterium]
MEPRRHRWEHHDERLPVDPDLAPDDPAEPALTHRPVAHVRRARQHDVLGAIAVGGFLGTLGRYGLELAWKPAPGHLPWATFAINTSGAFLLGFILTVLLERVRPARYLRPFLCVGVLGAWTTMSSLAVESDLLVRGGHGATAAAYVGMTVFAGVAVAWTGILTARAFDRRRAGWLWR